MGSLNSAPINSAPLNGSAGTLVWETVTALRLTADGLTRAVQATLPARLVSDATPLRLVRATT